ncbi:dinitrogenase iron-molybdenum cofactor biosynthesis protein [candidate division WOR-1 bacterium RIFOXYD2_FULL_36_8]|uniref:Dinitrogenase iron-molybdenum cofactor biosynthesis protein n=1 Tax=candidate division WOR-1 bacterium RIFOXYB2_FULL_36_35 TaxID=1802578 RepID=A0A1F4S2Z2_UNCSA|nr:MAG: dinitrogenase iron-molybdenum cofactor biosynthesis protein [candidate division WOR-1 bacterium RIFOXYA2_FULL_36_21]OGC14103.1 MAG: dinitrogenase iron-molybdenum cofactor biosynthesis protein [candidate division WOR-1 bacterium RIFOXYB2_FULL_36_35]OGC16521.1 MAG: dinitrogenase iron-molybdenum cofactor biosynthesis protein [candidate division WOR-1 bacterium RIFOXYA12_FULL_36_13]OGC39717.1 MAG: dinitrogenase iron-molybdenum cofactor biosynthesis protein [candidate division WOR-1 bacterium
MKICITSTGDNLDSAVDPRFGRCAYFMFVDTETLEFKALANPNIDATGGAGIQSSQFVSSQGVSLVATGNVGPNAFQTLSALKIKVFTGANGTIRSTIADFKAGKLNEMTGPSVSSHFGQGDLIK